jgi:hypothetical protein
LQAFNKIEGLCTDCFIVRGTAYLEYENGTLAGPSSGLYNHHAVVFDNSQRPLAVDCASGTITRAVSGPSIVVASAADTGNLEILQKQTTMPTKKGYYVKSTSSQMLLAEIMNYAPTSQTIYVVAEAEYYDGKPEGFLEGAHIQLSAAGCDKQIDFLVPSPQYSKSSQSVTIPKEATIITMAGHMHDGGDNVELKINDKTVCVSRATYGDNSESVIAAPVAPEADSPSSGGAMAGMAGGMAGGHSASSITSMSACTEHIKVVKGDKLTITANYDIIKHPM